MGQRSEEEKTLGSVFPAGVHQESSSVRCRLEGFPGELITRLCFLTAQTMAESADARLVIPQGPQRDALPGFDESGYARERDAPGSAASWALPPPSDRPRTEVQAANPADAPQEKLRRLLEGDFITDHIAGLPAPLVATFRAAFGFAADEGATTEVITAISLEEAQDMLKACRVHTSETDEPALTGLELGRLMAPFRRSQAHPLTRFQCLRPPTT